FSEDCTAVPCFVMFILTRATEDGVAAAGANLGIGFANGTEEVAISVYAEDGSAGSDTDRAHRTSGNAFFLFSEAAVDGNADFSAWLVNGIQVNVTSAFNAQYLVTAVIFGGASFQSVVGAATLGNVGAETDVNTVGFEPDLVFVMGIRRSGTGDSDDITQFFSFGAAVNGGSQGSIGCDATDGVSSSEVFAVTSSQYALRYPDVVSGLGPGAEVTNWDAQGFSLITRDKNTTSTVRYAALDLGTAAASVFDIDAPTSTGSSSAAAGIQSQFGMVLGTLARSYDAKESDSDADSCMIGVATMDTDSQFVNEIVNDDGAAVMDTSSGSNDSFILMNPGDGSCAAGSCYVGTMTSFGATTWNLDYTSVFSDATRKWIGLAIGAAPAGARRRGVHVIQ
ncbi:MAG TPA: hypothetical protein VIG57_19980, partial [Candidatus Entotheonella sp.]